MRSFIFVLFFSLFFIFYHTPVVASEISDDASYLNEVLQEESSIDSSSYDFTILENKVDSINSNFLNYSAAASSLQQEIFIRDYFRGIILNCDFSLEYISVSAPVEDVLHYYLLFNVNVDSSGKIVPGLYPCIDCYFLDDKFYSSSGSYSYSGFETPLYGSMEPYSALTDRVFHLIDLYVGIIIVVIMFILFRKRVFS